MMTDFRHFYVYNATQNAETRWILPFGITVLRIQLLLFVTFTGAATATFASITLGRRSGLAALAMSDTVEQDVIAATGTSWPIDAGPAGGLAGRFAPAAQVVVDFGPSGLVFQQQQSLYAHAYSGDAQSVMHGEAWVIFNR